MYKLQAQNLTQLKRELKQLEGKLILKLTRVNSFNDGEFVRVLHKVKNDKIIFWDGLQECCLQYPKAKDIIITDNGFSIGNCKYEIIRILEG